MQFDVHAPHPEPGRAAGDSETGRHGADAESERANWHAHLLITTRRLEGEGFAAKKARDLDPEVRSAGGRARVADGAAWGELWREHQDRYFREHVMSTRVDTPATHAQEHIGPVRMRKAGSEIVEQAEAIRQANEEAARDPEIVLGALTRNNATFTERDVARFLAKRLGPEAQAEIAGVLAAVMRDASVVPLFDRETGAAAGRFTTREVREQEQAALASANRLAHGHGGAVTGDAADEALKERRLRPDQMAAFTETTGAGRLKLIEGRAGTGKSYTLAAIRDAHELDGWRVVGLAPTNAVAQDLARDGFGEARTVHVALFALKNGRAAWNARTAVGARDSGSSPSPSGSASCEAGRGCSPAAPRGLTDPGRFRGRGRPEARWSAPPRPRSGRSERVAAQIERDKVGVPKLSAEAMAVLERVREAGRRAPAESAEEYWTRVRSGSPAVARAWEAGRRDPTVAAEIDRFQQAVERRLGPEGAAAFLQGARTGSGVEGAGMEPGQRQALAQVARGLEAARDGQGQSESQRAIEQSRQAQREHERARERRGPSLRLGR